MVPSSSLKARGVLTSGNRLHTTNEGPGLLTQLLVGAVGEVELDAQLGLQNQLTGDGLRKGQVHASGRSEGTPSCRPSAKVGHIRT